MRLEMQLTYYNNTSILVESNNKKVLFDPWLTGTCYYGSWAIYPPINIDFSIFQDIDYIHISHIHPDHLHKDTLKNLPDVPVLIHKWDAKFVKANIESTGKQVIELDHGAEFDCGNNLKLSVYAADGCNPALCHNFFGCGKLTAPGSSVGIDTFSVLDDGKTRLAQINDCPYALCKSSLDKIKPIDIALVGYTGASSYPQCWYSSHEERLRKATEHKTFYLNAGLQFLNHLKPRYYMPYAGTYVMAGRRLWLEDYKATVTRQEALSYYNSSYKDGEGFLLSPYGTFSIDGGSTPYIPENKTGYTYMFKDKYDYEYDEPTNDFELLELANEAYKRYAAKMQELNYTSSTNVYIYINNVILKLAHDGTGLSVVQKLEDSNYVSYKMDCRLLKRLLMGPKYANFNNADIGSHITFKREPDVYDRKLYYLMNYFHV